MPLGILFWVIWVVWVLFCFAVHSGYVGGFAGLGAGLIIAVLIGILGWKNFGPVVQ